AANELTCAFLKPRELRALVRTRVFVPANDLVTSSSGNSPPTDGAPSRANGAPDGFFRGPTLTFTFPFLFAMVAVTVELPIFLATTSPSLSIERTWTLLQGDYTMPASGNMYVIVRNTNAGALKFYVDGVQVQDLSAGSSGSTTPVL